VHMSLLYLLPMPHPISTLFPYTTLFRSLHHGVDRAVREEELELAPSVRTIDVAAAVAHARLDEDGEGKIVGQVGGQPGRRRVDRSEEHTSELQSRSDLVCRLLLEKKNTE